MTSKNSRKIFAAAGMAIALIAIAVVVLHSKSAGPVAESAQTPAPNAASPAADTSATAPVPAAAVPTPDAAIAAVSEPRVDTKASETAAPVAVEPKLPRSRHQTDASTGAVAATTTVTRTAPAVDASEKPAVATVVTDRATEPSMAPLAISQPADDQMPAATTDVRASDSQITSDVKSAIAGDSASKDLNIGVTTSSGVVALSGTLANQGAIDEVKDVAGKVKDVKSVDTSALLIASL
jgi:hyperosmotically inducible periplasmic protein